MDTISSTMQLGPISIGPSVANIEHFGWITVPDAMVMSPRKSQSCAMITRDPTCNFGPLRLLLALSRLQDPLSCVVLVVIVEWEAGQMEQVLVWLSFVIFRVSRRTDHPRWKRRTTQIHTHDIPFWSFAPPNMDTSTLRLFHNGTIYSPTTSWSAWSDSALLTQGSTILKMGPLVDVQKYIQSHFPSSLTQLESIDLKGSFLLPAFIDSHVHLSMQGESLDKVNLDGAQTLEEIQDRIRSEIHRRGLGPGDKIQVKRFVMPMLNGGQPRREDLDKCSENGQVAVFVEARDLHSVSK